MKILLITVAFFIYFFGMFIIKGTSDYQRLHNKEYLFLIQKQKTGKLVPRHKVEKIDIKSLEDQSQYYVPDLLVGAR